MTLLGLVVYVIWGLLNGSDIGELMLVPVLLGALGGFLVLTLWLTEKTRGVIVTLVYAGALATLGAVVRVTTEDSGAVAFVVVPVALMGAIFLAAGLMGR